MKKKVINYLEKRVEKPAELNPQPGEDPRSWLSRNSLFWLCEMEKLAFDPEAPRKVRLDALRELANKTIPPHSVREGDMAQTENPMRDKSDEEVAQAVVYEHPRIAELVWQQIEKNRKDPEGKDSAESKQIPYLEHHAGDQESPDQ